MLLGTYASRRLYPYIYHEDSQTYGARYGRTLIGETTFNL